MIIKVFSELIVPKIFENLLGFVCVKIQLSESIRSFHLTIHPRFLNVTSETYIGPCQTSTI